MKLSSILFAVTLVSLGAFQGTSHADTPRIAVWDPEHGTRETRFQLDLDLLNRDAAALTAGGCQVSRVTAAQIADSSAFSATKYDALLLTGETLPIGDLGAIEKFSDAGGVVLDLGVQVPFLIAIAPGPDGFWQLSPQSPPFAWQRTDLQTWFGIKYTYRPAMHDQGTVHHPTPLLLHYLPAAAPILRKLPSRWITPSGDGAIYPLLRSQRADGLDVTPQIYVAQNGAHTAIIANPGYADAGAQNWPAPASVLVALAHLAGDLRSGAVQARPATAGVDPDGATPIQRWGKFDGSCLDLAPALPDGATGTDLPRSLGAGASVTLALPSALTWPTGPCFVRVRGAYNASDAGLTIAVERNGQSRAVWNELFTFIDTSGGGNHQDAAKEPIPTEFTRIAYLPAGPRPAAIALANPGKQPVYFDAVQIETQAEQPPFKIGLNSGSPRPAPEFTQTWSMMRVSLRTQYVGPAGDPNRWVKLDKIVNDAYAANAHVQGIFEGTPDWAAISPDRYAAALDAKRPGAVPPDPDKYAQLASDLIARYGSKIESYEIWNEPDLNQFWRGNFDEYAAMSHKLTAAIRKAAPTTPIIGGGMSGPNDLWATELCQAGVPSDVNILAFHPYAGKTAGWDTRFGQIQSALFSNGVAKEIYCDECGFAFKNGEWFQPPPEFTPAVQAALYNEAVPRLFASGDTQLCVFAAGPNQGAFDLFASGKTPLPAYDVLTDYMALAQNGGRRLNVAMTGPDGAPLQGIYCAAASHVDGSATLIINPCEATSLQAPPDPSTDFPNDSGWTHFFGTVARIDSKVTVTPDPGKKSAGFYQNVSVDIARTPWLDLDIPSAAAGYDLLLKLPDGKSIPVLTGQAAGPWRGDLRQLLPAGTRDFQVSFRVYGATVFGHLHFVADTVVPPPVPVMVDVVMQVVGKGPFTATGTCGGVGVPVSVVPDGKFVELKVGVVGRTVVGVKGGG